VYHLPEAATVGEDEKGALTEDTEEGKPILFVSLWMGRVFYPYQPFI
jgi:hypothetical protein